MSEDHNVNFPPAGAGRLHPEQTADGSMTLQSDRFGQAYHSRHGARTESLHVFLGAGWEHKLSLMSPAAPLRILEMGLGTGLNALLTLAAWRSLPEGRRPALTYVALEPHPVPPEVLRKLNTAQDAGVSPKDADALHARPDAGRHDVRWGEGARLIRLQQTWQEYAPSTDQQFDLIYFDAFAPDSQPELWTEERLREAHELLAPDGILVTYCSKGDVRRAMKAAGLNVEKLPGPPGKREMLRATRPDVDSAVPRRFNVRVYFFLVSEGDAAGKRQVLLSDEILAGKHCTKWPGGGLEFGEGPRDCALREAREELGQDIELGPLVHATGGFVRSAWRREEQVLCHYYFARLEGPVTFRVTDEPFDFDGGSVQSFRWVPLDDFDPGQLTFATDREAMGALMEGKGFSGWATGHH